MTNGTFGLHGIQEINQTIGNGDGLAAALLNLFGRTKTGLGVALQTVFYCKIGEPTAWAPVGWCAKETHVGCMFSVIQRDS